MSLLNGMVALVGDQGRVGVNRRYSSPCDKCSVGIDMHVFLVCNTLVLVICNML